ncbi:MAG: alpha/beta hydrolase [Acidobacteria bacterium]|nr:alpha/beta hydrolase [Acidobacteriota bacterium]
MNHVAELGTRRALRIALTCLIAPALWAQATAQAYPPQMDGAVVEVYKTIGEVKLNIYIFNPPGHAASAAKPAIVFFFGGGWRSGNPRQFEQQCRYLASRGMVAMTADYRVASRHNVKAVDCVRDAKSAIRWVRRNAARLGVDPRRIAAGGGSAGGHLAAATGTISDLDEPGEDLSISSRPNALVLFNPAVVLAPAEGRPSFRDPSEMRERAGIEPERISPFHHVSRGAPPAIIFHGKADTTVPYATVELFTKKMTGMGNRCELAGFDGEPHGFFNYGRGGNKAYRETLTKADEFLASLGYLKGPPTVR